ncbi:MAG: hypothetical protein JWO73_729 [Candidatus Taylorbacteria bacterium]|nr:hypothetical protein [Candidatus Taylorbacteria bacterium]
MTLNNKSISVIVASVLVIGAAVFFGLMRPSGHIPAFEYQAVYRLVPENVSKSAAIRIELPAGVTGQPIDVAKQVSFEPSISGRWLEETEVSGAAATYDASQKKAVFYYKPNSSLDVGVHHDVILAMAGDQSIRSDFMTVADPEVRSILPHGDDEVMTNTKISIVFNRPMVPLSTLDQFDSGNLPVTIAPKTPGRYKWISTNTLQFIPEGGLISSAHYTVKVNAGFHSLEGLDAKPAESSFTTIHMRFWSDGSDSFGNDSRTNAVRGYNQPLLVRFNQAVDLDKTRPFIKVSDSNTGGSSVQYTLKYASATADGKTTEDQTMLAIYPAGGEQSSWEAEHQYVVIVDRAFPKSGGDISVSAPGRFAFVIDKIYSGLDVLSPRTNQASLDRFDPTGQLAINLYEAIDLSKSKIRGPAVAKVEYGEKCQENVTPCAKVPDRKRILVSFNAGILRTGATTEVVLDSVISDLGAQLASKPLSINLTVYQPLSIYGITADAYLDRLVICSNNPIDTEGKSNTISADPGFVATSWQRSYLHSDYASSAGCGIGRFETAVYGYLNGQTKYRASLNVKDIFGQSAQGAFDFVTRQVTSRDYLLRSYQDGEVVTVPAKTKLTFAVSYLPEVTATVCKLSPYDLYRLRNGENRNPKELCSQAVQKTIALKNDESGLKEFSVDIKDYFPQAVGNYAVLLSSPLITENSDYSWKYFDTTYVSVTNLIVTEKRIDPLDNNNYDSIRLTGEQIGKLQNLYWVIDAATQKPVSGASVSLFKNGAAVETATTDDKGLAFLTPVAGTEMAVASYGADAAVISGYSTKLNYADNAVNIKKMYIYSDKPIYRPGQEVDLKGLYRLGYDGYYELPPTEPVTLTVIDSGGDVVKTVNLTPNNFGSIHTSFVLPASARLGSYSACVKYQCTNFSVLDYSPAAFKVTLQTTDSEYFVGDKPEVNLDAAYYFGVPVSNASAEYHVSTQYYHFDKYAKEYFNFNNLSDDTSSEGYYYGDRYVGDGHAALDAGGHGIIKPALDAASLKDPQVSKIVIVDATVKNQQGRSVSSQKSFVLNAAPTYLGSKIEEPFVASSDAIKLKLKSVDTSGNGKSSGASAALYRVSWVNNGGNSSGSGSDWQRKRELVKTFSVTTDSSGDGELSLPQQTAGQYEVDVTSQGTVGSRSWFYVYGDQNVSVRSSDDTSLELVPSSATVKTGDTAEILIKVPEGAGKALVTIERGKVFSYEVMDITGTMNHFKFPVTDQYYPNVYVSVTVYSPNRSVRFGSYSFAVDSGQKKLNITVQSDKKFYNPGDPVTLQLTAKDEAGQPVASEISLAVVDMSVLALRGNPKKDPLSSFYGHVYLTVATYSNFKNLLKQVERKSEDGKGGSGGDSKNQKSRGIFKEVAFWKPDIITDAAGNATVKFMLPDNLTTWQAEVVGITADTHVGAAYSEFTTNKTLMVVPLKPRFVLPGDRFSLGATVFNNSKVDFNGIVKLKADSLVVSKASLEKNVGIKAGSSQTIYWDAAVPYSVQAGTMSYSISAGGQDLTDAVDDELIVNENTAYEVTATAGQTDTSAREALYVPSTVIPGQGGLTLKSSATLAVYLGDALKYMLDYPYECTEQISSRIETLALMKNAGALVDVQKKKDADKMVLSGLQSIYDRQNPDGGFKLWPESRTSSYWGTLEAIKAFDVLQRSGYSIDASVWDKSAAYVHDQYFAQNINRVFLDPVDMAAALFTRPRYVGQEDVRQAFEQAAQNAMKDPKIPNGKLITLSQIMHRYQLMPSLQGKTDLMLENRIVVDSRGSFLDIGTSDSYADTAISNTARFISLLSENKQSNVELPNLLRWLTRSRSKDGAWGSTENTLAVVQAFTSYLKWQPETSATFTLDTSLNGTQIDHFDFKPDTILTQLSKIIPMAALHSGALNTVSFAKSSVKGTDVGKIYYDMSFKYYLPAGTLGPRDEGFAIQRNFYALSDKDGVKPMLKAKVGDVMREHIEITVPATRNQVALEDFIPAGMEIVDTSLATEDKTLDQADATVKNPQLWPDHKEWRDDRAFLYFDQLSPGTYQFDYLVRALVPGTYTQLPANVSEMYVPENFGRSGAGLFTIEQ